MKGITDYFKDASKASPESESSKSAQVTKTEVSKEEPKPKKKKRKRKLTDPEVKNVAELLSNNLSLVSPGKTHNNMIEPLVSPNKANSSNEEVSKSVDVPAKKPDTIKTSPKVDHSGEDLSEKRNAFEFLMSSRHNIIGRNVDGKESENANTPKEKSPTLKKRKDLLQKWAERKGSDKRKREEEQVEKCIKFKLEKRAKRLKKMLQGEADEEEEQNREPKKRGPKAKVKNILNRRKLSSSESENSNLGTSLEAVSPQEAFLTSEVKNHIAEEPETNMILSTLKKNNNSPSAKKNGNLLSFLGIFNKKADKGNDDSDCSENSIKVFEETPTNKLKKDIIKIKMFTPNNNSKVHPKEDSSLKKDKKKARLKQDDVLNDSLEDFSSPTKKKEKNKAQSKVVPSVVNPDSLFSSESSSNSSNVTNAKLTEESLPIDAENNRRSLRKRKAINYSYLIDMEDMQKINKSKKKPKLESDNESIELLSSDEFDESSSSTPVAKKPKSNVKLAPVFAKSTPKPKVDPEVLEARRQFLLSSIPDSMKRTIEKQKSEIKEFDVFPAISHIQQKCDSKMWNLSRPELLYNSSQDPPDNQNLKCQGLLNKSVPVQQKFGQEVERVKHLKSVLQKIKAQNPAYPVYKVFSQIYEKSGKQQKKVNSKKQSKNKRKSLENYSNLALKGSEMWTEKYKPTSSADILGNYRGVKKLKDWLETWKDYAEEINTRKRKFINSNSESEFESTDCDSRDSSRLPGNTMILHGPSGSGKTSAVYAIAKEFGFNVLELNASTKRSGKKLLQELHEATQSHQVRKSDALAKFVAKQPAPQQQNKKMCILLLEDIDLIFEQDDGFLSSLSQLVVTSKRPIILTTTDITPPHVQKFMCQYDCVNFMPLSVQCLAVWLQIVCLVEGILADKDDLGSLLEYNRGDIRKTLLEVQFWCQSGGQLDKEKPCPYKTVTKNVSSLVKMVDDDLKFELSEEEVSNDHEFVHKNSLSSFEVIHSQQIPEKFDIGLLWWNIPDLLGAPHRQDNDDRTLTNETDNNNLKLVSRIYDSLALTDILFKHKPDKYCSKEPVINSWSSEVLNSLELTDRREDRLHSELSQDLCHNLVNGSIESYRKIEGKWGLFNMAAPDIKERRCRENQHSSEEFLKRALPLSNILDRGSVAMDFLPVLRDIGRFEDQRAATNTKRGNRFRHYLRDLNINFDPELCKLACGQLNSLEN
ncbi:ATPase family AAA domain-containing protein 5 [Anthonomus grandis grandis]|uniref:ATPase family AAA domain-containing protein 5 n=1 Tax=Anthonomus grandis grandis TaxID=2921223 RepID=UPI00216526DC|nr:ATPase family AAA domain-containing protein 5 [Anthonomus grandis grandis]